MGIRLMMASLMSPKKEPVSVADAPHDVDREEYLKLAERAGFRGAAEAVKVADVAGRTEALREFLAMNGICVYPERSVTRYMDSITPARHQWGWRDLNRDYPGRHMGYIFGGVYAKPIPEPVLVTMAGIREQFPTAIFEVTDISDMPKGDPFLRVRLPGSDESFIIERWDEPGFRM